MTRLRALWVLLRLPRIATYEALDALQEMRAFYDTVPHVIEDDPPSLANRIVVRLGPPIIRPDFHLDPDDL